MHRILEEVRQGMGVVDRDGEPIGTVDFLHFGDDDASTARIETPAASPAMEAGQVDSVIDVLADMLRHEDMPESHRQRLTRRGFMRLEGKDLSGADRYVMPSRIASVSGDTVVLKVSLSELRHRDG